MRIIFGTKEVNGKKVRYHKTLEDRKCKQCGDRFEPKRSDSVYCSRVCGKKADAERQREKSRIRAKKWYQDNIEKAKKSRKKYYFDNVDRERKRKRDWYKKNTAHKREQDKLYKDKTRHGDMREDAIEKSGLVCSKCGDKKSDRFDIVMHHTSFDNQKHEDQELLCRSCHGKIHMADRLKL